MAKCKAAPKQGSGTGGTAETAPAESVYLGKSIKPEFILLRLANRHGLITGATGTGKTVTLQGLAEGFSDQGVRVLRRRQKRSFWSCRGWHTETVDRGACQGDRFQERIPWLPSDLLGPVRRARHSDPGHDLRDGSAALSRLMDLNETQEGVLNIAFKLADEEKCQDKFQSQRLASSLRIWPLGARLTTKYGNIAKATVGSIQRSLLVLEQQGADISSASLRLRSTI